MTPNYQTEMAQAKQHLLTIQSYRVQCTTHSQNPLHTENPINSAKEDWFDLVQACEESIEIYKRFNARKEAAELAEHILDIGQSCEPLLGYLALRLYHSLANCTDWLEQASPGIRKRLRDAVRWALHNHLDEMEARFWLLTRDKSDPRHMGIYEFLRDLVDTEEERKRIDIQLCQAMELGAHLCEQLVRLEGMIDWYHRAAIFCQDRVGDADWAAKLMNKASEVYRLQMIRPVNPYLIKALAADALDSPDYVEAMDKLDMQDTFTVMLRKGLHEQHKERFLPTPAAAKAEYDQVSDKLRQLVNDPRFVVDHAVIRLRQAPQEGYGLLNSLQTFQFVDQNQNRRGAIPNESRFVEQYVCEVEEVVSSLLLHWQSTGSLSSAEIIQLVEQANLLNDSKLINYGIEKHFQKDYIAAVHVLMPQLEELIRRWLQKQGIDTKRVSRTGGAGEALLNDLVQPDREDVKAVMGEGFFDLVYWYLVNSTSSFGYRHKVAHGWLSPNKEELSNVSAMLIWILVRIVVK